MIKVLTIVTSHFDTGGITKIILNYYKNLNKKEFKMDFVVTNKLPENIKKEFNANNSKYYVLESRKRNIFKYLKQLEKIIKDGKYQIVHAHGNSATLFLEMYAAYKANCKVRIAHSHNTTCTHKFIDKLLRPLFYKYCNYRFACGELAGKWLYSGKDFFVIPNGNDIKKFSFDLKKRNEMRKMYNLENKRVFGHVGRFNEQKNQQFIINIFYQYLQKNKNSKLVLIGSGMNYEKIKDLVKELKIEEYVIFTGEIDNVEDWINACDLMLLPSRYEGFPVVLVEWQISGLPCIVSDRVSRETKLTDLVKFVSLDEPTKWIELMSDTDISRREEKSQVAVQNIIKQGFDIVENTKLLENKYREFIDENNILE